MAAKKILFVHQNFPGQFPHIADACRAKGYKLAAIAGPTGKNRPGVDVRRWNLTRSSTPGLFEPATRAEADLLRADVAANVATQLKADGFIPDLIIGHPGWGETLHLGEVFPGVPQILFAEFFYKSHDADVGFDKEFETHTLPADMRVNAKNATLAMAYCLADVIVCPTGFQAGTLPKSLKPLMRVFHEGIDISNASRRPNPRYKLPNGKVLDGSKPVITFINRNFERLRGYHIMMRALPEFLERVPEAEVVLIGGDEKGYGGELPNGGTWREKMHKELGDRVDWSRVHHVGKVPHTTMIDLMSMSWGHVYYTYPFILSWSVVEAMACECLVIGSDTGPVRDAITSGENGVLNDFFDVAALSNAMAEACEKPEAFTEMRKAARRTALAMFDRQTVGVPAWIDLIDEVLNRQPAQD